jgi:Ala-tRNA(Pro) deacylase
MVACVQYVVSGHIMCSSVEREAAMIPASVANYLEQNHAHYSVIPHRVAYTAQEEAAAAHVPGAAWAKSVVCIANDELILAVVPAPCSVDLERLKHTIDADSVRLALEAEFMAAYRECEPGAMPPFGPLFGQRVVVDAALASDPEIVFSGGSHRDAIRMPYREFERLSRPTIAEFATHPSPSVPPRLRRSIDPVCGTEIEEHASGGWSEHLGERFYFCSPSCKMEFDDNPFSYIRRL